MSEELNPAMEKARKYRETKARQLTEFLLEYPVIRRAVERTLEVAFLDGAIAGLQIATDRYDQRQLVNSQEHEEIATFALPADDDAE